MTATEAKGVPYIDGEPTDPGNKAAFTPVHFCAESSASTVG